MRLTVRFFASLREELECGELEIEPPDSVRTVADLRTWLAQRGAAWQTLVTRKNLRAALDQRMVAPSAEGATLLCAGAEVAFFPPVTGG